MPYALFNRFELEMSLDDAESASHQGQCDDDVAYLVKKSDIAAQLAAIKPEDIAAELEEYGAWDEEELADEAQNLHRLVWIAAGNITEESRNPTTEEKT
jgi:hypothetical protein